ncbi:MAG: phosphatase PAP2 family protein [Halobacteriovoraceae bacterium]|jgi:membrane-associated phospholipid phosphatase|nr:phosphatase PAP2 family protein [Halobacteriovoraceae bacterium]MBT5094285.1 phosphatase PAP2 family protein [Halobacteriovoraceae bacterium]
MRNHSILRPTGLIILILLSLVGSAFAGLAPTPPSDENRDRRELEQDFNLPGSTPSSFRPSDFGATPDDLSIDNFENHRRELFLPFELGKGDFVKLAIAAGAIVMLFPHDEAVRDFAAEHQSDLSERLAVAGEFWGSGLGIYAAGGAYIVGLVIKNKKIQKTALFYGKAAIITGIVAQGLKRVFHRERPGDDNSSNNFSGPGLHGDDLSFPSGHTITSFTLATFIAETWGHKSKIIPVLAYGAATIGGLSRVHDEAHWLTDIIFGAIIGHLVTKAILKADSSKSGFVISPYLNEYGNLMVGMTYQKNYRQKVSCSVKLDRRGNCPALLFDDEKKKKQSKKEKKH